MKHKWIKQHPRSRTKDCTIRKLLLPLIPNRINTMTRNAISLFSSSGIGDLGLHANDINTVIACELIPQRANLFQANNPQTVMFNGNIWDMEKDIISYYKKTFNEAPFLILATPPCQGMSSNGMGTILRNLRKGIRPKFDERNRLIIPTLRIIKALKPEWIILENVPNMNNTLIMDDDDNPINIIEFIKRELGNEYIGRAEVIDVCNYGVPQHRKRLISIFTRDPKGKNYYKEIGSFIPTPTHSKVDSMFTTHWKTLRESIWGLPPLTSKKGENIDSDNPLHKVPVLDDIKLSWIHNTPEGDTAFNNQCINSACKYMGNKTHGTSHDSEGINRANSDTPLFCEKCGTLLPRPYVENKETGEKRIMKGFTSAYKRMYWDEPSSTLTQNFQYACSDNKVHPDQDRVLSLYEGLIIQTIANYNFSFIIDGKLVSDGLIRDTIGESVPPLIIDILCKHILKIIT